MKKGLVIAGSIISVICIITLALMIVSIMGFEPESDNILHDTSENGNSFNFNQDDSYVIYVYAIGSVDCSQFEITITDSIYDYFDRNCGDGDLYTTNDYTFLGDLTIDETGTYEISAEGDVIIVNANDVGTDGFISIASCGCCMVGLILLIVGLATGRSKQQVMMIQPDGTILQVQGQFVQQQPMSGQVINQPQQMNAQPQQMVVQPQQNNPQPKETTLEEYSFEHKNEWE
jgi:hypothetical protein